MGRRGLNAKDWFYGFNARLAARPKRTARILCGPAAERWLAAEMYGYLAGSLPGDFTCYGEDGTTDLTIYETSEVDGPPTGAWARDRVASIEVKLVYRWYSDKRVDDYTQTLCAQVLANRDCGSALNVGFCLRCLRALAVEAGTRPWQLQRVPVGGLEAHPRGLQRLGRAVRQARARDRDRPVRGTIGGVRVPFGLVSQYIRRERAEDI